MATRMRTVIYPVTDLYTAKAFYAALFRVAPVVDEPSYVAFQFDGQDIGLDPNGYSKGMTGPEGYWHVEDLHRSLHALVARGAQLRQAPQNVGGGKVIASVRDPDDNVVGLIQEM